MSVENITILPRKEYKLKLGRQGTFLFSGKGETAVIHIRSQTVDSGNYTCQTCKTKKIFKYGNRLLDNDTQRLLRYCNIL
jgi:RNase P subunit RPR2